MNRSRTLRLILSATVLLLSQLACASIDETMCIISGGKYIPVYRDPDTALIEQDAYCDRSQTTNERDEQGTVREPDSSTLGDVDIPLVECLVPDQDENWDYENLTGEEGKFCNAEFVYRNNSDQTISIIVQESWDSNAQSGSEWNSILLDSGQEWTKRSSYAWRPDDPQGDTFNYVSKLMVVYYNAGCSWLTYDQEPLWEEVGKEILAPCH